GTVRALIEPMSQGRRSSARGSASIPTAPMFSRWIQTERVAAPKRRDLALTPVAWIVLAHVVGAAAIGALDAAKLRSTCIAGGIVRIFAATGLAAGALVAIAERLTVRSRWWLSALVVAAPTLIVTIPVARTLFDGAFAQTLPLAAQAPVVVPI